MRLQMIKMANDYLEKRYEHDLEQYSIMKLDKVDHVGGDEISEKTQTTNNKRHHETSKSV